MPVSGTEIKVRKKLQKKNRSGNVYGKNVFVTGASSGIGQACAIAFAKSGCEVTGVSRSTEEKTERFPGGGSLTLRRLDVTDEAAVREFILSKLYLPKGE